MALATPLSSSLDDTGQRLPVLIGLPLGALALVGLGVGGALPGQHSLHILREETGSSVRGHGAVPSRVGLARCARTNL